MSQSELKIIVMENWQKLEEYLAERQTAYEQEQTKQAQAIQALESRQTESEQTLQHLTKLYETLTPLIEAINSAVKIGTK